jgi:hypothetical protein
MKISLSGRAQTSNCLLSSFQIRLTCGQADLTALFMIEKIIVSSIMPQGHSVLVSLTTG